ncbi:DUF6804 family protein [Elusimicrobiota bacterium]
MNIIPFLASSAMLFIALLPLPYGYYMLLRVVVCGTGIYGAVSSWDMGRRGWSWALGIVAFVFNPLMPLHLGRGIWFIVDIVVAVLFIVGAVSLRGKSCDKRAKNE